MKIFKQENVYVVVNRALREEFAEQEIDELVFDSKSAGKTFILYGGRVVVRNSPSDIYGYITTSMFVDGILIRQIEYDDYNYHLNDELRIDKIAAFLNQIENLGVDTFLGNYKERLEELKKEIETLINKIVQTPSDQLAETASSHLDSLKDILAIITCTFFALLMNLNAGLENNDYTEAYNTIMNLYF